jgi:hypothetical protein
MRSLRQEPLRPGGNSSGLSICRQPETLRPDSRNGGHECMEADAWPLRPSDPAHVSCTLCVAGTSFGHAEVLSPPQCFLTIDVIIHILSNWLSSLLILSTPGTPDPRGCTCAVPASPVRAGAQVPPDACASAEEAPCSTPGLVLRDGTCLLLSSLSLWCEHAPGASAKQVLPSNLSSSAGSQPACCS